MSIKDFNQVAEIIEYIHDAHGVSSVVSNEILERMAEALMNSQKFNKAKYIID
jgi:hypothetical protein